jgi:hypothetical protein
LEDVIILGGVIEQHFNLGSYHLELLDTSHLRVVPILIFKILLLGFHLSLLLHHYDVLVKRNGMLFLVPHFRIFGPCVAGFVELGWGDDVAVEGVVELEVEEGEEEDLVLFEFEGLEVV